MKTIKFIIAAIMLAVSTNSFAQFANSSKKSGSGSGSSSSVIVFDTESYGRLSVSYSTITMKVGGAAYDNYSSDLDRENKDKKAIPGVSIGYLGGISLSSKLPFFVEIGGNLNFNNGKHDKVYKSKIQTLSISVPVNFAYKLTFRPGVYVEPYAGISGKINILGREYYKSDSANMFDSKDVGYDKWNRFQFGGQIGLNVGWKKLNLNMEYGWDSPLQSYIDSDYSSDNYYVKTNRFKIGVGVNF